MSDTQVSTAIDPERLLKRIADALDKLVADKHDPVDPDQEAIRCSIAEIARRMGRTRDIDNDAVLVERAPSAELDRVDPISPARASAGNDVSIYGNGLQTACKVTIDGTPAVIRRRLPGEVAFTVPAGTASGSASVGLVLDDGTCFSLGIEIVDACVAGGPTKPQQSRPSARKG